MIRIQGLHKFFNKGRQNEIHVINDVSLELPERGMVAVFGKSGCGKTTLLNVIGGLDSFKSGSLTVEGQDIRQDTDTVRNRSIGYIFQNYNLNKSESCFENVADALRLCGVSDAEVIETRVLAALANVGMEHYKNRLPDTLSGGQQQRIAIARAIVKNPRIILADEPTGNLDDANTVLVMDLLREIARDHLVLLVTHEADLVDDYCDQVIELHDGAVKSVRQNSSVGGHAARSKNEIYLGELEKSELSGKAAELEYYGDAPAEPLRLRVVNHAGKLYLQVQTPGVQLLDESSELRLREGVYHAEEQKRSQVGRIDMSKLPPLRGTRFGRLFSFRSSLKSGYDINFRRQKKGKRLLQICMGLFAAVLVFMSANFGTAFDRLGDIGASYNHNVFYVYTPGGALSEQLNAAAQAGLHGMDSVYHTTTYRPLMGDLKYSFETGFFESFSENKQISSNAVLLHRELTEGMTLLAGKGTELSDNELLISSQMADRLLESSTLSYIQTYEQLIGLPSNDLWINGKTCRIGGIVRASEPAIYLSGKALAAYAMNNSQLSVAPAAKFGLTLEQGETVRLLAYDAESRLPAVGEQIKMHGMELTLKQSIRTDLSYKAWCAEQGIKLPTPEEWAKQQLQVSSPELAPGSTAYKNALEKMYSQRYYEFLNEHYYARLSEYMAYRRQFGTPTFDLWLYFEKGVEEVRYLYVAEPELYDAAEYQKRNGRYPAKGEIDAEVADKNLSVMLENYQYFYERDYPYSDDVANGVYYGLNLYLVSDADYEQLSRRYGTSEPSVLKNFNLDKTADTKRAVISEEVAVDTVEKLAGMVYTVVHTSDPAATETYLRALTAGISAPMVSYDTLLTPGMLREELMREEKSDILSNLISMAVFLLLMCVCMYFIMRSALMGRVKEIGIYRAIGVSRRNMVFRFFTETLLLTTLTVFVGFLLSGLLLRFWMATSPLMTELFYYPLWLSGGLFILLYGICILCGLLPILSLLRKTPSRILAKYDI